MFDDPVVFRDPLALRILGMTPGALEQNELRAPNRPYSRSLRAFVVARSCLAEETLQQAVAEGWTQYVLLGAGLDTFACRNPYPQLQVFEVDHLATQLWKQGLLVEHGIQVPDTAHFVPVDFEREQLLDRLLAAGFQPEGNTVFAWLGVVPYLTAGAMRATLEMLGELPGQVRLVLDYVLPRAMLPPNEQLALDSLSARVALAGEPFLQFFSPEQMEAELGDSGLGVLRDLDGIEINARYFAGRGDGLGVLGKGARLLLAENAAKAGLGVELFALRAAVQREDGGQNEHTEERKGNENVVHGNILQAKIPRNTMCGRARQLNGLALTEPMLRIT